MTASRVRPAFLHSRLASFLAAIDAAIDRIRIVRLPDTVGPKLLSPWQI
jgi:hypothetical protein